MSYDSSIPIIPNKKLQTLIDHYSMEPNLIFIDSNYDFFFRKYYAIWNSRNQVTEIIKVIIQTKNKLIEKYLVCINCHSAKIKKMLWKKPRIWDSDEDFYDNDGKVNIYEYFILNKIPRKRIKTYARVH